MRAGSRWSLPFVFLAMLMDFKPAEGAPDQSTPEFKKFTSSCINLGWYDLNTRKLTIRFENGRNNHFYRYENVPPIIWNNLLSLNGSGSVGNYLNETILKHPKKYPSKVITVKAWRKE